jgi:membrane protein DedA with SNARE-associated domain
MTALITATLAYLLLYKYVTLFLVAYLAALILPLPSNTSLIAASAFASQGYLNMPAVFLVAFVANVLGDWTGFFLSRKYGKVTLMKIGFKKIIESDRFIAFEKFIITNGKATIFITRFVGGIGPLVNILTGLSKDISFKKFLIYGVSGELVYVISLSATGYFLGTAWQNITDSIELVTIVIVTMFVLFVARKVITDKFKFWTR